jgi:hypothetical protein
MERLVAFYRQNSFKSADFGIVALIEQGADDVAATVLWTIERHGAPAWRFHTGYALRRIGGAWRIVFCSAYEEPATTRSG